MALSIASLLSRSKSGGILITLGPAEPRPSITQSRFYLIRLIFRNLCFVPPGLLQEPRLLSSPPAEAPLDGVLLWRIRWRLRRIPDLSCLLVGGPPPAANSSSLVTLSARVQAFSSSGWCKLIFERSGCFSFRLFIGKKSLALVPSSCMPARAWLREVKQPIVNRARRRSQFRRKKRAYLRPKSVEGVCSKYADAEYYEKRCNSFKHRGPLKLVQ